MRVRRPSESPDLKPTAVAILLRGYGARPPEHIPSAVHRAGGGIVEVFKPGGPAALWLQHGAWLRAIAREWGWEPATEGTDGVLRFYAEDCAEFGKRR